MPKLKLIIISSMILLFSIFNGLQARLTTFGIRSFFGPFIVTLLFFSIVFIFQTLYYIAVSKKLVKNGELNLKEYQSPIDIWLISIPFCVLMLITYLFLNWYVVQIFICATFALIGMLLGNALGRGGKKWSLMKSLPFFTGVIASILFSMIMGRLV